MKIGIIGGGSIGLLVSNYVAENHHVTLYVRRVEQQMKIKTDQLHLLKSSKVKKVVQVSVKLINELQQKDLLIICVKQVHVPDIISYLNKIDEKTPLIFLQNGMGHISAIKQLRQQSYVGVVEHGAYRINDNSVDHLGQGVIKLASITGSEQQLQCIVRKLHQEIFPFERTYDWNELLKNKLIINAVINPLTTLFDVPNGSIVTDPHIQFLARKICEESAAVLSLDVESSWKNIIETARNTYENTSSMRADVKHERPTEIGAISGYILSENKTDRQLPYTTFVYYAILSLSHRKGIYDERSTNE